MSEETAKALIEALNRFSGVLEKLQGVGTLGGIHIYHHGIQPMSVYPQPSTIWPHITCGSTGSTGVAQ